MKNLQTLIEIVNSQAKLHQNDVYNYAIPQSWNIYGYPAIKKLRDRQLLVNPYTFYAFTLQSMFKEKKEKNIPFNETRDWIKQSVVYSLMIKSATAWDHDRDNTITHNNLYHLSDSGTFLKSIALLPLLKRMGVNTILLYQPFALGKTLKAHDYAAKEAVFDFNQIDENLSDPIVKDMDVLQQAQAFMEACHYFDFKVLLEYCPSVLARDNVYLQKHPDWFYWIPCADETSYHAPIVHNLPQNTMPYPYTQKDLHHSEDVKKHIAQFVQAPTNVGEYNLTQMEKKGHLTTAPSIVDQINANIDADKDTTLLRFYQDQNAYPIADSAPYMLQDSIRCDLYPGKQPIKDCWKQCNKNITWFQKNLGIDGIFLMKPYLLPVKLQKEFVKTARKNHPSFVMIAEDTTFENSSEWLAKGYDMMSGNSGYEEGQVWEYKFHNFAYRLRNNDCPLFAASEFYDSKRIASLANGKTLAILLTTMNQFLPNGVPFLLNGIEAFETQPAQLSQYGDPNTLYSLPKEDPRYLKQAFLDQYYVDYLASDLSVIVNLLEKIKGIRKEYLSAIIDPTSSIPLWFDSPKDPGIGFTFVLEKKALMVVCNVNVAQGQSLHIHSDNLIPNLPFTYTSIRQIFSTKDPYIQDVNLDECKHLSLFFEPGEVKFIEFQ